MLKVFSNFSFPFFIIALFLLRNKSNVKCYLKLFKKRKFFYLFYFIDNFKLNLGICLKHLLVVSIFSNIIYLNFFESKFKIIFIYKFIHIKMKQFCAKAPNAWLFKLLINPIYYNFLFKRIYKPAISNYDSK